MDMLFQCAAEAAHGVAFEMRKEQHAVVMLQMRAYEVLGQMASRCDGDGDLAVGVHDVARRNVRKAVLGNGLPVGFCCASPSLVGGVAFHNGSV